MRDNDFIELCGVHEHRKVSGELEVLLDMLDRQDPRKLHASDHMVKHRGRGFYLRDPHSM